MRDVIHTSRIKIVREKVPTRKAMIEGFSEPVYYGVHGGIMNITRCPAAQSVIGCIKIEDELFIEK